MVLYFSNIGKFIYSLPYIYPKLNMDNLRVVLIFFNNTREVAMVRCIYYNNNQSNYEHLRLLTPVALCYLLKRVKSFSYSPRWRLSLPHFFVRLQ